MSRFLISLIIAAVASLPAVSHAAKAGRVTTANAASMLVGGSDSSGGIDDWAVSNEFVHAVIDDIGTVSVDVVGGTISVPKTSSNAVETGGTLIDLGRKGKNNDQLAQSFNVGGLSLANVFIFRPGDGVAAGWTPAPSSNPCASVEGADPACPADPGCAAVTVYGIMLAPGLSTRSTPTLWVRSRYQACDGERALQMRTEIWNKSGGNETLPIFDIFLWGGKGPVPFAAHAGRGFNHPRLNLSDTLEILAVLTESPYFAAPGNVGRKDGVMSRGKPSGGVTYGFRSTGGLVDTNGPLVAGGEMAFLGGGPDQIKALHSNLVSAVTFQSIPSALPDVPNNGSVIFNRRLQATDKNDVASVVGDTRNPESILSQINYAMGTVSGRVIPGSSEEGTITFVRTAGTPEVGKPVLQLNSPISEVRAKGSFRNVLLPEGTYQAVAVFPGRADLLSAPFVVTAFANTVVNLDFSAQPKVGKLKLQVVDTDTGLPMPAKISLSPSPSFKRDYTAFSFNRHPGMCSNDFNDECTSDAECTGVATCFRTCSNVEPARCTTTPDCSGAEVCASDGRCRETACTTDAACGPGNICVADSSDLLPEGYGGGPAQLHVVYAHDGKVNARIRPGTYTLHVSRGLEYTIQRYTGVTINPGQTTDLNLTEGTISLKRVVDTTGYVSADFHIHSGRSLDSATPLVDRVRSYAGEGVEIMVSTDHDINTDYLPAISKLKLAPFITSIVGTETTTSVGVPPYFSNAWGHINAWPQPYDANLRRSGAVEDENGSASVIYDRMRDALSATGNQQCIGGKSNGRACTGAPSCPGGTCVDVGTPVVQMNHARGGVSAVVNSGIFTNTGFNPALPVTDCQKYPVICPSSQCVGGSNEGAGCTQQSDCLGGGVCGCVPGSAPAMANGCNAILTDLNAVPQATLCTTAGCGSGFENDSGTRNIDFDVMEVDNGGGIGTYGSLRRIRRDWLSLLNQGVQVGKLGSRHFLWGTGVSDSHRYVQEQAGFARSYVGAGDLPTPPSTIDIKAFNEEIIEGNMVSSSGPYIELTVDDGSTTSGLGETLAASGTVNLNISVQAAPWIPVEEVRIIKNGCVLACFNSSTIPAVSNDPPADPYDQGTSGISRFNAVVQDTVSSDSYYIVEASPDLPTPPGSPSVDPVVDAVVEDTFPFGFTNPIFVDADSGGYTGIGVPQPACATIAPPGCSGGAVVAAAPASIMMAESPRESGFISRLFAELVAAAIAHEELPPTDDESELLAEHEKNIRRSSDDYYPLHLIRFPTPQREAAEPKPLQSEAR